jgi:hypothetical protein
MNPFPEAALARLEVLFHALIRERARPIDPPPALDLPRLREPLPSEEKPGWFPVPGMYGGFAYWAERGDPSPKLVTESWCRVVGGSGQRHEITEAGCRLVDEGFV